MTENLREYLLHGKYTHWMAELSDDELGGLLWLVGEYAARASTTEHDLSTIGYPGNRRKYGALNAIAGFRRDPKTLAEVRDYIRGCIRGSDVEFLHNVAKNTLDGTARDRMLRIAKQLEDGSGGGDVDEMEPEEPS